MKVLINLSKLSCTVVPSLASRYQAFHKTFTSFARNHLPECVAIHPQVKDALEKKSPVVALESAIITHGMQYPFNFQTALDIESIIKKEGALPATVGVIDGKIYVGLSEDQIEFLAKCRKNCMKVSRRDFPYILSKNIHGGTTVAGTMFVSHLVGIPLFVTGGIGGVHRGGQTTMDVSADLTELGRTPVTVVSAGLKSILDVGRTLEYLETQGVCVASIGPSKAFPDFFTRDSGFEAPCAVESYAEAAQMMLKRKELNLDSGILFAVPIPVDQEADGRTIKKAIDEALSESEMKVRGRDVTPFVLRRVSEITEGKSLLTNIDLIKNNARYGARIAVEYSKISSRNKRVSSSEDTENDVKAQPVVIGGSIIDLMVKIQEPQIELNGKTHKGKLIQSFGGVGRNIADALTRLNLRPLFVSAIGEDAPATALLNYNPELNLKGILREKKSQTASYSVLLDFKGEALIGVGDMAIHESISPQWVRKFEKDMERAPLVILDGNVGMETMKIVFEICGARNIPVWYEPTDTKKAAKPWDNSFLSSPSFASPNLNEFNAIIRHLSQERFTDILLGHDVHYFLKQILSACKTYLFSLRGLMVTFGAKGFMIVRWCSSGEENLPLLRHPSSEPNSEENLLVGLYFSPQNNVSVTSVSGAGDCLASGFIAGMLRHNTISECASIGLSCAALSLQASEAVPKLLNTFSFASIKKLPYTLIKL